MYMKTASSQQFLNREAMHSTKGSRRGFDLLNHGVNPASLLSPEQRRQNLVARAAAVEAEMLKWPKNHPERKELGKQKNFIQNEIHSIRPKLKLGPQVVDHFITVAKERLSPSVYRTIMDEASARAGADREKLKEMGFE